MRATHMTNHTPEEDQFISSMKESRHFNVRNLKDWLDLGIKTVAVLALAGTAITFTVRAIAPGWVDIPSDISSLATEVSALRVQIDLNSPQIVEYKGNLIASKDPVKAGDSISMTAVLRRNVGCDSDVRVRFFDHNSNTIATSFIYETSSNRSPVSRQYGNFSWQVKIPDDLPPGLYSYFPEVIPKECGVYGPVVAPMSNPFTVTN